LPLPNSTGLIVIAIILLASGCASSRETTTKRTAIEQALMSQSAQPSIQTLGLLDGYKSFHIVDAELESDDKPVIVSSLREELLVRGWRQAPTPEEAEVLVHVRANFSAVDDSSFLIGLPALPLPIEVNDVPISLPEIALFKKGTQIGRNEIAVYALEREDGSLVFRIEPEPHKRFYTRWKLLIFFNFRSTDLGEPF